MNAKIWGRKKWGITVTSVKLILHHDHSDIIGNIWSSKNSNGKLQQINFTSLHIHLTLILFPSLKKYCLLFIFITLKSSNFIIIFLNIMSCARLCQISKKNIIAHVQLKEIPLFLWQFYQIQEEKLAKGLNLAKDLQYKVSQNYCDTSPIDLGKFVMPNLKCEL